MTYENSEAPSKACLSNPNYGVISNSQGVGTIVDDEPRLSISDVSKKEGKKGQTRTPLR